MDRKNRSVVDRKVRSISENIVPGASRGDVVPVPGEHDFVSREPVSAQPSCHTTRAALRPSVYTSTFALDGDESLQVVTMLSTKLRRELSNSASEGAP